jgi:membrane protease YdiL (CAAX protease family)
MTTPDAQLPEAAPPTRLTPSSIVCWIVIFALVGVTVYRNAIVQPPGDVQKLMDDQRARLVGLIALQLKALEGDKDSPWKGQTKQSQDQIVRDMQRDAHSPEDRLRTAIVIGELQGKDAALAALEKIQGEDKEPEALADVMVLKALYVNGPSSLDEASRDRLVRRHGDVGKIALAYGVEPTAEPRKSLQATSFTLMLRLIAVAIGFCVVALASLVLFIVGVVWAVRGKIRRSYVPESSVGPAFLEGFTIYLVLYILMGLSLRMLRLGSIQWIWLATLILPVLFGWVAFRGVSFDQCCRALGWHRGRGVFREIVAGISGYIGGLAFVVIGGVITLLLVRISGARVSSPVVQELRGGVVHVLGIYAVACIFAPIMEETMFRGALFSHLRRSWGWAVSAGIVAFVFAMLHPQGWVAVPALGSIAMVLAALREWRGSLIAPIAAHACNNFIVLTLTLLVLQ